MLGALGLPFEVEPSDIDECEETWFPDAEAVRAWVAKTAAAKADAVAAGHRPGRWVIGADTIVVLGNEVLHKPADDADAKAMLTRLQGRTHTVMTAIALRPGGGGDGPTEVVETQVTFYPADVETIDAYVARGESLDKAGAYAAQGAGSLIIERFEGCYFNVVGLPVATLARMLAAVGYDVWAAASRGNEATA